MNWLLIIKPNPDNNGLIQVLCYVSRHPQSHIVVKNEEIPSVQACKRLSCPVKVSLVLREH